MAYQVCMVCGNRISLTSLDQEFCSQQCYDQNPCPVPIRCIVCNISTGSTEYPPIRICSRECWDDLDRVNFDDSDTDDSEITRETEPESEPE